MTIRLTFVSADGSRQQVDAAPGGNLMELAVAHNIDGILGDCGGNMVCGTCHVRIPASFHERLPAQQGIEAELLQYVPEPQPDTRLCCQIPVTEALDGIEPHVPRLQR